MTNGHRGRVDDKTKKSTERWRSKTAESGVCNRCEWTTSLVKHGRWDFLVAGGLGGTAGGGRGGASIDLRERRKAAAS